MKFSDFQQDMMADPSLKIKRKEWKQNIYIFWSAYQQIFMEHKEKESDHVWNWNGETTLYEDLTADDWVKISD